MIQEFVILPAPDYKRLLALVERTKTPTGAWPVDECAAYLGVSTRVVYELANADEILCFRVGVQIRFHPPEVVIWRVVSGKSIAEKIIEAEGARKRRKKIKIG